MAGNRMSKESKRLYELALSLGWSVDSHRNQQIRLTHPNIEGAVTLQEQLKEGRGNRIHNVESALRRAKKRQLKSPQLAAPTPPLSSTAIARALGEAQMTSGKSVFGSTPTHAPRKRVTVKAAAPAALSPKPAPAPPVAAAPAPAAATAEVPSVRAEVSVSPLKAKHGMTENGGSVYDSAAVLEVIYDNGEIEYRCSQCDYEKPNHRSVSAHYSVKHGVRGGAQLQLKETGRVDPSLVWEPNRVQSAAISRLAAEIERAIAAGATDPRSMASSIVEARAKRGETENPEPIQALTPDQILAKIRLLLDDGTVRGLNEQLDQANDQIKVEREIAERARRDLEEAQNKLEAKKSSYRALAEIVAAEVDDLD